MNKRALIGLGQSGTFLVDHLAEFLSDTDYFCINSYEYNATAAKYIPLENRFCFGQESGFAQCPKLALEFLEANLEIQKKMYTWLEQIFDVYDEVILGTFFTSGTGVGTLIDILRRYELIDNKKNLGVIICAPLPPHHEYVQRKVELEYKEISRYIKSYKYAIFLEYKDYGFSRVASEMLHFKRQNVLGILQDQRFRDEQLVREINTSFCKAYKLA